MITLPPFVRSMTFSCICVQPGYADRGIIDYYVMQVCPFVQGQHPGDLVSRGTCVKTISARPNKHTLNFPSTWISDSIVSVAIGCGSRRSSLTPRPASYLFRAKHTTLAAACFAQSNAGSHMADNREDQTLVPPVARDMHEGTHAASENNNH